MPADPTSPTVKSCQGQIRHLELLIQQWTYRRDHGDAVPSKEILTAWIEAEKVNLETWRRNLDRAERESVVERPLA